MSDNQERNNNSQSENKDNNSISNIIESLSPIERKIIPYLNNKIEKIIEKSGLDGVSVLRALRFLENKGLLKIKSYEKTIIDLGTNGIYYKKNHLPERKLLFLLESKNHFPIEEARRESRLSDNEFKAALGALKDKALISLSNSKLILQASKEEIMKKSLEEQFLDLLPTELEKLSPEQRFAYEVLKKRKEIIEIKKKNIIEFSLTSEGKKIAGQEVNLDLIEEVTPEIISSGVGNRKFRKYDLNARVPRLYGGKRHFVNQAIEYGKSIWLEMGFKEMQGSLVDSSFWVFDSLFTPQDHPAREMQDTFFIKDVQAKLPDKKIVDTVKKAHELGISESKGWRYSWQEKEAKKVVLRTHTTSLSAQTLSILKEKDIPAKYFSLGKVFRNETLDWSHGFEFYQSEGIVIDKNANFRHLLGYLKEFYKKMGFERIRFRPSFFAYTEPSVEIEVFHPEKKIWIELGVAGIFRPEVTVPLLGKDIPVLAWGQGFDRIIMDFYKIKDLREMYANDFKTLREKRFWIR